MTKELPIQPYDYALEVHQQIYTQYEEGLSYPRFFDGFNAPVDSPEFWQLALGPDVNGLTHPWEVYDRAVDFIEIENGASSATNGLLRFTELESRDIVSIAINHDIGELKYRGFGPGDIADPTKTSSSNHQESLISRLLIFEALNIISQKDYQTQLDQMFLSGNKAKHPSELFKAASDFLRDNLDPQQQRQGEFLVDLYNRIANNRNTETGKVFYLIEKMQYLSTGISAFQGYKPYPNNPPYLGQSYYIANRTFFAGETLQFHLPHIIASTQEFIYPTEFLTENQPVIEAIFDHVNQELDRSQEEYTYKETERESFFSWEKFNRAQESWESWKQLIEQKQKEQEERDKILTSASN